MTRTDAIIVTLLSSPITILAGIVGAAAMGSVVLGICLAVAIATAILCLTI